MQADERAWLKSVFDVLTTGTGGAPYYNIGYAMKTQIAPAVSAIREDTNALTARPTPLTDKQTAAAAAVGAPTVDEIVAGILAALPADGNGGATPDQVETAVRTVLNGPLKAPLY